MIADEVIAELSAPPFRRYDDLAARSPAPPPVTHGLYAWWQVSGALPGVPGVPHLTEPVELLYVGTAPRDAKSKSHLRKRLGNHHRAAIGSICQACTTARLAVQSPTLRRAETEFDIGPRACVDDVAVSQAPPSRVGLRVVAPDG